MGQSEPETPHSYARPRGSATCGFSVSIRVQGPTFRLTASWQAQATSRAGCRSARRQVSSELLPQQLPLRGFGHRLDTFDTSSVIPLRSSSCRSPDPVNPSLFLPRSRPWLLAKAAEGGLEPAPASRLRGAYPHQSNSCAPPQPFGCLLCSWHTASSARESHPHALPEPDVNVSVHTAPTTEPPFTSCQ